MGVRGLDANKILTLLSHKPFRVFFLEECTSTNTFALKKQDHYHDDFVIFTRSQTQGRGRFGRSWSSVKDHDLILSFSMQNMGHTVDVSLLMMFSASIVLQLLRQYVPHLYIKWPNDIIDAQGRKIAGILIETAIRDSIVQIVVGIGINVNSQHRTPAVSLLDILETSIDLNTLYIDLINLFFESWHNKLDSSILSLQRYWHSHVAWIGKEVVIEHENQIFQGVLEGFTDFGYPILVMNGQKNCSVCSGTMRLNDR